MPKERQGAVDGQDAEVSYKTHNKGISNADDTILLKKTFSNADFVQKKSNLMTRLFNSSSTTTRLAE